jgi:peptidoglycan biosynthesis protein MviN/MurJ (putative lipid II flippase)
MNKNKDVAFRIFLFILGMMLIVYGWRSFFKGLLDAEHQWERLVFGPLAVSTGLIIFYLLFLKNSKTDK